MEEKTLKTDKTLWKKLLFLLSIVGPGIIASNIDNDAGGIATYSLTGAHTGYRLMWVLVPITIALIMVQEMAARMGIATGKGLADLIREKFGLKVTFYTLILLIIADLGNTTAEFAGLASAGEIFGISRLICVPIAAALVWLLVVKGDYKIVERFFLAGCLVYLSYIVSGFIIGPQWGEISKAIFLPDIRSISASDLPIIVGLIGTSITPWMQFYLQASIVEKGLTTENLNHSRIDVVFGSTTMLVVTFFIMICCAATLFGSGIEVTTAKDAAVALEPLAGKYASMLFGIGLLNASFFAAALLPLATSYYVCEGMGWEAGVDKTFKEAPNFFLIFSLLILISASIVMLPDMNLFKILIWTQVLNGVLIPVVLIFMVNLCNDPDIMGSYVNSPLQNYISYGIIFLMIVANCFFLYFEFISSKI